MRLRADWIRQRDSSWGASIALAPLALASLPYAAAAYLNRVAYERGLRRRTRLPCHVIAVGSPLVGGSGKTPLVAWLAAALRDRGRRVAIATRGYGRTGRGLVVVSDGERMHASVAQAGDEPVWLARKVPGVPVVVCEDRVQAGRYAAATFGATLVILDDGLQHHRLHHDLAIAVLDGWRGLGNGFALPRGPLREPLGALDRADILAVWGGPLPERDDRRIGTLAPGLRRVRLERRLDGVRALGAEVCHGPEMLAGLEAGLLSALGDPDSLRRSVEAAGARVVVERRFADHHRYRERDLRGLGKQASIWLTSEKDAVKLQPGWVAGADVRVVSSRVEVEAADALLGWIEKTLGDRAGRA